VRKGRGESLKEELPLHIRSLYRYALALTRNDDDAHDLVQDCCTTALDKQEKFEPGTNLRAWLFTIMHNRHVSRLRKLHNRVTHVPVDEAPPVPHPSNQISRLEFRDLVAALDKMDEDFREVLILVTVEGMSYQEVSRILDVPIGTVTSRLSRARSMLRRLMGHVTEGIGGAGFRPALRVVK
jgi:RNA polymerase sigma-70 factor (ECF subfamily)